eukprot:gene23659-18800_t
MLQVKLVPTPVGAEKSAAKGIESPEQKGSDGPASPFPPAKRTITVVSLLECLPLEKARQKPHCGHTHFCIVLTDSTDLTPTPFTSVHSPFRQPYNPPVLNAGDKLDRSVVCEQGSIQSHSGKTIDEVEGWYHETTGKADAFNCDRYGSQRCPGKASWTRASCAELDPAAHCLACH